MKKMPAACQGNVARHCYSRHSSHGVFYHILKTIYLASL